MQFWIGRSSIATCTRVLAILGALLIGCATDTDQTEAADEVGTTEQALTYSPPLCGTSCVANGTLAAMNAAAVKYGFPRWFIYATVNRESTFNPSAQNGSGSGTCDIGYGLTQITCPHHVGITYPENLSAPNQSSAAWQGDMRIADFCSETGLCPWIDMANVTSLSSSAARFDPVQNLDRYFSGYAAPAFYLEKARAPQQIGETTAAFNNRILRRVAWHWRYGHYASFTYPTDPKGYLSGSDVYRWDNYAATYRTAVETVDGVWSGNVCKPPYSTNGCGSTTTSTGTSSDDAEGYDFEGSTDGWSSSSSLISAVTSSTAKAYSGTSSLAITFAGGTGSRGVSTKSGLPEAGATVAFRVWIPSDSTIGWVQPYVQQGAAGSWSWTTSTKTISQLTMNAWNTIDVTVPPSAASLASIGIQFGVTSAWTGTVYVDSVTW